MAHNGQHHGHKGGNKKKAERFKKKHPEGRKAWSRAKKKARLQKKLDRDKRKILKKA